MGSNQSSQIIRNRHFVNLEIRPLKSTEKQQMIGTVSVASNSMLQNWIKKLQLSQKQQHVHMLLPINWKIIESSICGSSKIIEIEYQNFSRLLSQQIKHRRDKEVHLQESQIWYLTWALSQVVVQCQKYGQRINDISLNNIFMNETGNIRVLVPFSLPDTFDPYFQPYIQDAYFSPEQLLSRKIGQMYNQSNIIKSTTFSVGMLLLSVCLLKPLYYLYDYKNYLINQSKLLEQINHLSEVQYFSNQLNIPRFHTDQFQLLIRKLLQIDPSKRVTLDQVYNELKPFINEISTLKSFQFKVPQPLPISPIRKVHKKQSISLKSHKASKSQSINFTPQTKSNIKPNDVSPPPLVESKYIPDMSNLGSGLQLLRKIDQKLQKSREQFPS